MNDDDNNDEAFVVVWRDKALVFLFCVENKGDMTIVIHRIRMYQRMDRSNARRSNRTGYGAMR